MEKGNTVTIVINTNPDKGLVLNLIIEFPLLKNYIIECYEQNRLEELYDYLMGVGLESNY